MATWLSGFCADNPPGRGDEFLLALMRMGSTDIDDITNKVRFADHGVHGRALRKASLFVLG